MSAYADLYEGWPCPGTPTCKPTPPTEGDTA